MPGEKYITKFSTFLHQLADPGLTKKYQLTEQMGQTVIGLVSHDHGLAGVYDCLFEMTDYLRLLTKKIKLKNI